MQETDRRAFLAAIAAEPEKDFPRLAFADWLEENGEETDRARAELIRVQCEMESDRIDGRRYNMLKRRQDELLFEYWREWSRELRELGLDQRGIAFRRGFVEHAVTTPEQFIYAAGAIFDAAPQLRSLELKLGFSEGPREKFGPVLPAEFFAQSELGRIHEMTAGVILSLNDADARLIAECPHLAQLTVLHLPENAMSDRGMEAISRARFSASLEHFTIPGNRVTSIGMERFAAASFPQLRILDVSGNRIADPGIIALAESHGFRSLSRLDVYGNPVGNDAAIALIESENHPNLGEICFPTYGLRDDVRARLIRKFKLIPPMDPAQTH